MKGNKGDYELRRRYAAEGMTTPQAAALLGIRRHSLCLWARKNGVQFAVAPKKVPSPLRLTAEAVEARRAYAAEGLTVSQAARKLGIPVTTLWLWAKREGVRFVKDQGGRGRPRTGRPKGRCQTKPAKQPAPLSGAWMAARLTEGERADYKLLRGKGGFSALQALASIRRHDLVAEVEAHLKTRKATA